MVPRLFPLHVAPLFKLPFMLGLLPVAFSHCGLAHRCHREMGLVGSAVRASSTCLAEVNAAVFASHSDL